MRKETIIEIILSTMEEMRKLTETFADKENIPQPFIDLLMTKYSTLGKEIQLLEFWKEEATKEQTEKVKEEKTEPIQAENASKPVKIEVISESEPEVETEEPVATDTKSEITPEIETVTPTSQPEPTSEENKANVQPEHVREVYTVKQEAPTKPAAQTIVTKATKTISSKDTIEYGTPVSDIRKAVGINDRFLFQRELFGGDGNKLNQTLDAINACTSYEEAHQMLTIMHWDETDPTVEGFLKAVHRRFL